MVVALRYVWPLCAVVISLLSCTKCGGEQDNFFVTKFNRTVLQEGFKYVKQLDVNTYLKNLPPFTFKAFGITLTFEKFRIKAIEGENFNFEFPGNNSFIFSCGFSKLSGDILVHYSSVHRNVTFSVKTSGLSTEFYVGYSDGEANLKVGNCNSTIGTVTADHFKEIEELEKIIVFFLDAEICEQLEKYFQNHLQILRETVSMTFGSKTIAERFFLKATSLTIDKEYITLFETVYSTKPDRNTIEPTIPQPILPNEPDKEHALFCIIGEGILGTVVKHHMEPLYEKFDSLTKKYRDIRYLHYYVPETRRIFPEAFLQFIPLHYNFDVEITPEWILLKANLTVEVMATVTCPEKQSNYSIVILDMAFENPIQLSFNDSAIQPKLVTARGNVTARNSSVGPIASPDLQFALFSLPKIFYTVLFHSVNAKIPPYSTKPLKHLTDDLFITGVNVTLRQGMLVLEESIRFESHHRPIINQTLTVVGGIHSIHDATIYLHDDPSSERKEDVPHICEANSSVNVHSFSKASVVLFALLWFATQFSR